MAKLIPNELLFAGNGNVTEEIDKIHDITDVETNKLWQNYCYYFIVFI